MTEAAAAADGDNSREKEFVPVSPLQTASAVSVRLVINMLCAEENLIREIMDVN